MTSYPSAIKTWINKVDEVDTVIADDINSTYAEVTAIETVLGTNPTSIDDTVTPGAPATVAEALDSFAAMIRDVTGKSHWYTPSGGSLGYAGSAGFTTGSSNYSILSGSAGFTTGSAGFSFLSGSAGFTTGSANYSLQSGSASYATTAAGLSEYSGWIAASGTWSYSSADGPTGVISVNADMTGIIGVGMRIKLTQTTVKYFIVTAVGAYSGGNTLITVYGGTDYTLASATITLPFYSSDKVPFGFPASPLKWIQEFTDTSARTQSTPTAGTWYAPGSLALSVPIGLWKLSYHCAADVYKTSATQAMGQVTLTSTNLSETDVDFTSVVSVSGASGNIDAVNTFYREKIVEIATKTSYYLNIKSTLASTTSISFSGAYSKTIIRAICAYL